MGKAQPCASGGYQASHTCERAAATCATYDNVQRRERAVYGPPVHNQSERRVTFRRIGYCAMGDMISAKVDQ